MFPHALSLTQGFEEWLQAFARLLSCSVQSFTWQLIEEPPIKTMPCESADPPTCRDPPFEIMLCESADPLTCRGPKSATQTVKTNVLIWWKIMFSLAGAGGWGPHAPATPPHRWLAGAGVSMHFWLAGAGGPRPPAPASGKPPPTPYPCDSTEPLTCRRRWSPPPPTCESKSVFFSISNLDCIFKHLKIEITCLNVIDIARVFKPTAIVIVS